MKRITGLLLILLLPCVWAFAQQQGNKKETTTIRGKNMGFTSVSPALEKDIEAKSGKKAAPDPKSKGPNAYVGKHGFAYVSPEAEGKKK